MSLRTAAAEDSLREVALAELTSALVLSAVPWRVIRSRRGQRHMPGLYWSSTTSAHIGYESRLELARLLLADNVKPADKLAEPRIADALAWAGEVFASRGWEHEFWSGTDAQVLANVRFLSGYRRASLLHAPEIATARALPDRDLESPARRPRCSAPVCPSRGRWCFTCCNELVLPVEVPRFLRAPTDLPADST